MSMQSTPKYLRIIFPLIGLIGFFDATYLTIEHFRQAIPPCGIGECERVLTSVYSKLLGIPVPVWGLVYYTTIIFLAVIVLISGDRRFTKAIAYVSIIGFAMSAWFVYAQFFLIQALCPYCLVSAGLSTLLFLLCIPVIFSRPSQN